MVPLGWIQLKYIPETKPRASKRPPGCFRAIFLSPPPPRLSLCAVPATYVALASGPFLNFEAVYSTRTTLSALSFLPLSTLPTRELRSEVSIREHVSGYPFSELRSCLSTREHRSGLSTRSGFHSVSSAPVFSLASIAPGSPPALGFPWLIIMITFTNVHICASSHCSTSLTTINLTCYNIHHQSSDWLVKHFVEDFVKLNYLTVVYNHQHAYKFDRLNYSMTNL